MAESSDDLLVRAQSLEQEDFITILRKADVEYDQGISTMEDYIYDALVIIYESKFGEYVRSTNESLLPSEDEMALPYWLGSLDTIRDDKRLRTWVKKYPGENIVEDKVDGLTLLLIYSSNPSKITLYTKSNKCKGQDVSHLAEYLPLPQLEIDIAIRGELVMTKANFATVDKKYKNARNTVTGITRAKESFNPDMARKLSFIAYRIMSKDQTHSEDIEELEALGFETPSPYMMESLDYDSLSEIVEERKRDAPYAIDGLVIYHNTVEEYPVGKDPKHVVAFKIVGEMVFTTVKDIKWKVSRYGKLSPVAVFDAVRIAGADNRRATCHNARFAINNKIGPGAEIMVIRGGDTVPQVAAVIKPSPKGECWPDAKVHGEYEWDDTKVELVVQGTTKAMELRRMEHFIKNLKIDGCGPATIEAIFSAGIDTIDALMQVSQEELLEIYGIGPVLSRDIYQGIHKGIEKMSGPKLLYSSSIFQGIGEKRFTMIFDHYPNFMEMINENPDVLRERIREVKGFNGLADNIADNMPLFAEWLNQHATLADAASSCSLEKEYVYQPDARDLTGYICVFSGFRDAELESEIRKRGGDVKTTVSGKTTLLIVKSLSDTGNKKAAADKHGTTIVLKDVFVNEYL